MKFIDSGKNYSHIFDNISDVNLHSLYIDCVEKKIPFNPAVTKGDKRLAFIGLNAYCGDDYLDAYQQPNFTVWCQDRYNSKIFNVMESYLNQVNSTYMQNGGLYFTDFVKAVLPASHFIQENGVKKVITSSPELKKLFQLLLSEEIESLINEKCKVFVCFGNTATNYFISSLNDILNISCDSLTDRLMKFNYKGQEVYVVNERHYSYYSRKLTSQLISDLNNVI